MEAGVAEAATKDEADTDDGTGDNTVDVAAVASCDAAAVAATEGVEATF